MLRQYEERVNTLKADLMDVTHDIFSLLQEDEDLLDQGSAPEEAMFGLNLHLKHLLYEQPSNPLPEIANGVKLPKIDVFTFDGNILNWGIFWDHFQVSIHSKKQLKDAEKLAYL